MIAVRTRNGNENQLRERERFRICRAWQQAGKSSWTTAEVEAELDARLRQAKPMPLFDRGDAAAESRREAAIASQTKAESRRAAVLAALTTAAAKGLTRFELASAVGVQQSSVCRPVLELLRDGEIVELPRRRVSAAGGSGCILVLACYGGQL